MLSVLRRSVRYCAVSARDTKMIVGGGWIGIESSSVEGLVAFLDLVEGFAERLGFGSGGARRSDNMDSGGLQSRW